MELTVGRVAKLSAGTWLAACLTLAVIYLTNQTLRRWHSRLAFGIWRSVVIAILVITCQAVAETTSHVNEKTKSSPVFLHEGIGIINSSDEVIKHSVLGLLPEQVKLCERSSARAQRLGHSFRKDYDFIGFACPGKRNLIEQHRLTINHPVRVISKKLTGIIALPWNSTSDVKSGSFTSVFNTKLVFIQGWEFIIGSRPENRLPEFNFYPRALLQPKLLNALPEGVRSGISGTLSGGGSFDGSIGLLAGIMGIKGSDDNKEKSATRFNPYWPATFLFICALVLAAASIWTFCCGFDGLERARWERLWLFCFPLSLVVGWLACVLIHRCLDLLGL